jgi:selenide, water dikinase
MNKNNAVRLTATVKSGGCASKLSPGSLDSVLQKLPRQSDANVLVGFDKADDAGVYKISPELALVQTVDFFTPVVDDPFTFGQIAATNALSDVYAMGGKPLSSLAMVCFPAKEDLAILERIMAGGLSKMTEAGCTVVGGHSVRDEEIKFGYAVTGTVHPDKFLANGGAKIGDTLIFTKALGTGVISTALKQGKADAAWVEAATKSMTTLNKVAAETAIEFGEDVHGATDVTGFGLMGHAREMALASNVSLQIESSKIPLLPGAQECVQAGCIPGGLISNRDFAECVVRYSAGVEETLKALLFDPQTAGGLLLSVSSNRADEFIRTSRARGVGATAIGAVVARTDGLILIR